ncbi:phospholipase D C-like [Leptopilina boulardi]|uniref:phospholipase D C-like n=1 Tax=Leptopilina boulardi TaxID=63433 RepID=UPI0021F54E5F|nr:phospholipase D C-like [Leptopilina boulardi]
MANNYCLNLSFLIGIFITLSICSNIYCNVLNQKMLHRQHSKLIVKRQIITNTNDNTNETCCLINCKLDNNNNNHHHHRHCCHSSEEKSNDCSGSLTSSDFSSEHISGPSSECDSSSESDPSLESDPNCDSSSDSSPEHHHHHHHHHHCNNHCNKSYCHDNKNCTIQDIKEKDQLSLVLRYVKIH